MDELFVTNASITSSTVSDLYAGGNGSPICLTPGCGFIPPPSESLNFLYPSNGTSGSAIVPFSNWQIQVNNVIATDLNYQLNVDYRIPGKTQNFTDSKIFRPSLNFFGTSTSGVINVPSTLNYNLWNSFYLKNTFTGSDNWVATATLVFTNPFIPDPKPKSNVSFFVFNNTSTFEYNVANNTSTGITTSTNQTQDHGNTFSASLASSSSCSDTCSTTDIGACIAYGLCVAENLAIQPSTSYTTQLNTSWDNFKNSFPFGVPFLVYDDMNNALANASNSMSGTDNIGITLPAYNVLTGKTLYANLGSTSTRTMTLLTSSTMGAIVPPEGANTGCDHNCIMQLGDYVMALLVVFSMYITVRIGDHPARTARTQQDFINSEKDVYRRRFKRTMSGRDNIHT